MDNNSAKILGLEDVIVKNVESDEKEIHISIEMPRRIHVCPVLAPGDSDQYLSGVTNQSLPGKNEPIADDHDVWRKCSFWAQQK